VFSSKPTVLPSTNIAKALVMAKRRGVMVSAILDRSNLSTRYSAADFLKNAGIFVMIDNKHAIADKKSW
jgi:Tfp pilus assembly protein PilZ